MATFLAGYLALGTGSGTTFVEQTGAGYARLSATLLTGLAGQMSLQAGGTYTASAPWSATTQMAMLDATGNALFAWPLAAPFTLGSSNTYTVTLPLAFNFPDLASQSLPLSGSVLWTARAPIGSVVNNVGAVSTLTAQVQLQATQTSIAVFPQPGAARVHTVSGTGTNQATAAALSPGVNIIVSGSAGNGLVLPALMAADTCSVKNNLTVSQTVYAAGSATINGVAATTGVLIEPGQKLDFVYDGVSAWYV